MSVFHRVLSGLAVIGTGTTLFRVVPVLWPLDPVSTLVVALSLVLTILIQLERAVTGKAAA